MAKIFNCVFLKNARLYTCGLVFFLLAVASACHMRYVFIELVWKDNKAVGVIIPGDVIPNYSFQNAKESIKITLSGSKNKDGILGNITERGHAIYFEPLIPFSPGSTYDILQNGKEINSFTVPLNKRQAPQITVIYPQTDTVPENLLKIYISFSQPMRTGDALSHITLLDKNRDTMQRVFLDLQPELWDKNGKVLTLWLDPGRIKRDLVLNRQLGNPLKKSEHYELVINGDWKNTHDVALLEGNTKKFTVSERDGQIPDINNWRLMLPKANTINPLVINIPEPLDHYLLEESVTVLDEKGNPIKGNSMVSNRDKTWTFVPKSSWMSGHYQISAAARLEDLAGNNLNRVFDRDIRKDKQQNKEFFVRGFEVR